MLVDTPSELVRRKTVRFSRGVYFGWSEISLGSSNIKTQYTFLNEFTKHMENNQKRLEDGLEALPWDWENTPDDFGVCDSYDQVLARWPSLETDPRHFQIWLTEVRREDQSEHGGWRWHKWGPYLGTYEIKHEYLYDEDIERVFPFSIIEVNF